MDDLLEFIFEVLLELGEDASSNKKISKWIRYPILIIILIFYIGVVGITLFVGLSSLKENKFLGIILILLSLFFVIGLYIKIKKLYTNKKKGNNNEKNIRNKKLN